MSLRLVLIVVCVFAVGCIGGVEDDTASSEQEIGSNGCSIWMCGANSPVIDGIGFHDLSMAGVPNKQRLVISDFFKGATHYTLKVAKGALRGTNGLSSISGAGLKNAEIRLKNVDTGAEYAIRILDVGSTPYVASPGGPVGNVETYKLHYAKVLGGAPDNFTNNVCSNPPSTDNPEALGMNVFHAVLFESDVIHADTKTVSATLDKTVFNIGCASHALAKMMLTGHTEAAKWATGGALTTTWQQRQAILKMWSGDYCGDGTPFTVAGTLHDFQDDKGWMHWYYAAQALEARWTEHGASCLDKPRLDANPNPLGTSTYPDVEAAIAAQCKRPSPCSVTDPGKFDGHHLVSANPL
jgi:hypothetical protein